MKTDTKLLDGTVEEVEAGLGKLNAKALGDLLAAEQAGKNRKGVIDALEKAQTAASLKGTKVTSTSDTDRGDGNVTKTVDIGKPGVATAATADTSGPANIAPAEEFDPSGAPRQTTDFDPDHVAVDNNPRANTTADQNRIDFNDPIRPGREIVEDQLSKS